MQLYTSGYLLPLMPLEMYHILCEMSYMDVLTYSEARAQLKAVMDGVVDDHAPVIIARRRGRSVVMMSLEDWSGQQETDFLLANPVNAERLRRAKRQIEAGEGVERELIQP